MTSRKHRNARSAAPHWVVSSTPLCACHSGVTSSCCIWQTFNSHFTPISIPPFFTSVPSFNSHKIWLLINCYVPKVEAVLKQANVGVGSELTWTHWTCTTNGVESYHRHLNDQFPILRIQTYTLWLKRFLKFNQTRILRLVVWARKPNFPMHN